MQWQSKRRQIGAGIMKFIFKTWKKSILTIELSVEFDFGHPTPIPDIFGHRTVNIVHI
jgi:hypothetical protein